MKSLLVQYFTASQSILFALYALILALFICKTQFFISPNISTKYRLILWFSKIFISIPMMFLGFVTSIKDGGDVHKIFRDGQKLQHLFFTDHTTFWKLWFSNGKEPYYVTNKTLDIGFEMWNSSSNYFMVKLSSFFSILALNSYPVYFLLGTFFSFIGILSTLYFFEKHFGYIKQWHYAVLFYIPFFFIYYVGFTKDTFFIFCLGILLLLIHRLFINEFIQKQLLVYTVIIILLFFICFKIRWMTISAILFFSCITYFFNAIKSKTKIIQLTAAVVFIAVLFYVFDKYIVDILQFQQYGFTELEAGSALRNFEFNNSFSILQLLPESLYRSTFEPFPYVSKPIFMVAIFDSVYAFFFCIFFYCKTRIFRFDILLLTLFLIAVALLFIIGLTTNNVGTIIRYRAFPYFMLLIFSIFCYRNNNVKTN